MPGPEGPQGSWLEVWGPGSSVPESPLPQEHSQTPVLCLLGSRPPTHTPTHTQLGGTSLTRLRTRPGRRAGSPHPAPGPGGEEKAGLLQTHTCPLGHRAWGVGANSRNRASPSL